MSFATSRPAITARLLARFPAGASGTAPIVSGLSGGDLVTSINPALLSLKAAPVTTDRVMIRQTDGVLYEAELSTLPSLVQTISTKTANYTIVAGDLGKNFSLGGTAYFTLTVPQPATMTTAGYAFTIENSDILIPKLISVTNSDATNTTFRIYGRQAVILTTDGTGNWCIIRNERYKAQSTFTLYVATTGSDAAHGMTVGAPLATMTEAYRRIRTEIDLNGNYPYIQLAAGTYTESVDITSPPVGSNLVYIVGDAVTPGNVVWRPSSTYCCQARDFGIVIIRGVYFLATGVGQIACYTAQLGVIDLDTYNVFGNFVGGTHIYVAHGGAFNEVAGHIKDIPGSVTQHVFVTGAGSYYEGYSTGGVNFQGAPAITTYLTVGYMGQIDASAATPFTGTFTGQDFIVNPPARLSLGANNPPGTIAGVTNAIVWQD